MKHKITIPEPCHENWDKMTPKDNGRFCMNCSKTVVDFTSMMPDEIRHYFLQNQNEKICGRFRKSQLNTITIQIPSRVLYTQTQYYKMFLLALFIAMGTTLFSCQDKNGNKQKIDTVEVVPDTSTTEPIAVGKTKIDNNNSNRVVPPPKVDQVKFEKPAATDCGEKTKTQKKSTKTEIYVTGEVTDTKNVLTNAEFPGGIDQFYTFFGKEFKTPESISVKNLKIRISFAVEKNGSMSYMQSDPAIDKTLENEIIRVLSVCPKWQPGESNGKKIKMQYSLPIAF